MLTHLRTMHGESFKDMKVAKENRNNEVKENVDETVRGTKCIYKLRTKLSRREFLDEVGKIYF